MITDEVAEAKKTDQIKNLAIGSEFYFSDNRSKIFHLLSFQTRANGSVKSARCLIHGKLYPVFISAAHSVNVLSTPVINKVK